MKKYTIIANCQGRCLQSFLNTNNNFKDEYEYMYITSIQNITKENIHHICNKIVPIVDLIIIQPISDNYKNYYKYSTKYILSKVKKKCKIIMFPSIWFNGYYPSLIHYKINKNNVDMVVQDSNFIKIFINTNNKLDFINHCKYIIFNNKFYSYNYINNNIQKSIHNLYIREYNAVNKYNPPHFINISPFIKNNYNKHILFYTANHCSKEIYIYLCNSILDILNIKETKYPDDLDPQKDEESCVLYNSVKNAINPNLSKTRFSQRNIKNVNLDDYLSFHYDCYLKVKHDLLYYFA